MDLMGVVVVVVDVVAAVDLARHTHLGTLGRRLAQALIVLKKYCLRPHPLPYKDHFSGE